MLLTRGVQTEKLDQPAIGPLRERRRLRWSSRDGAQLSVGALAELALWPHGADERVGELGVASPERETQEANGVMTRGHSCCLAERSRASACS
jgi:hypothetical protein